MLRLLLTLKVALALFQASIADDVTVDVSKLMDFTTTVTWEMDAKSLEELMADEDGVNLWDEREADFDIIVQGKLIANIPGEMMKLSVDVRTADVKDNKEASATYVLTFDGRKSYVAMEFSASTDALEIQGLPEIPGKLNFQACAKFKFDPNMIPPSEAIKHQIDQEASMAGTMANQMPHEVKGDLAFYPFCTGPVIRAYDGSVFPDQCSRGVVALRVSDGTPVAFWNLGPGKNPSHIPTPVHVADLVQGMPPVIKFGDFTKGEPFAEVQCAATGSATQMLDSRRAKRALFLAEQLLDHLQVAAPIAPVTRHLFAQLPRVLRNPDAGKTCMLSAEPTIQTATPIQPLGFVGFAAVCMVSAAVGAGIAATAVRRNAFSKPEAVYMEIS